MSHAGQRIIEGLKQALAGDLARVTIDGQTWVRIPNTTLDPDLTKALSSAVSLQTELTNIRRREKKLTDALNEIVKLRDTKSIGIENLRAANIARKALATA